ncbi:biotin transporter BioY [Prolixibacteraceae bacterium JC049]|nr:biotin transporter BioY [Prolixibacteraceae bacterium JC049]
MKRYAGWVMAGLLFSGVAANAQKGAINAQELESIRGSFKKDAYTTAMQNALMNNDIKKLAFNHDNQNTLDHQFKYRVNVKGITNQRSSGRCWMFTSMNVLRPKVIAENNLSGFQFSQNYLYFWDIFEKSNLFLNNIIQTVDKDIMDREVRWYFRDPASDGGVWNNFVNLVKKYGLVPKTVMNETHSSESTSQMIKLLKRKLRENGLELRDMAANGAKEKALQKRKVEMMKEVYRMLALNLGTPPTTFEYRFQAKKGELANYKKYTPQEFAKLAMGDINLDDYVMIMNDPTRPYYKHYDISNYRNVEEGENWHYVNLPNDVIKEFCIESIKNNEAMYGSCDVGKQLDSKNGISDVDNYNYDAVYGVKFGMNKKQRILSGESGSSHGMAIIAVDVDENGQPTKWQFENSWGASSGHNGYLTFTDKWFDEFMFRFVIHKKFLSEKVRKIYEEKAIELPAWDPMF